MPEIPATRLYAVFHLNLAFSCVEPEDHATIVDRCYDPLLDIVERDGIPLGIELSAYTLERLLEIRPDWVARFKTLLAGNRCELIASGDSQIAGPLVPARVNRENLRLGQLAYRDVLDCEPQLAYANEQAVSPGVMDCYRQAGYQAVVAEWDNLYSFGDNWQDHWRFSPQSLRTASGDSMTVIWNQVIPFQKLQRCVHGELSSTDYLAYVRKAAEEHRCFSVYGNDAEVFGFRPGTDHSCARKSD